MKTCRTGILSWKDLRKGLVSSSRQKISHCFHAAVVAQALPVETPALISSLATQRSRRKESLVGTSVSDRACSVGSELICIAKLGVSEIEEVQQGVSDGV